MFIFGAGDSYGVPLTDAQGNAVANPTPIKVAVQQSASLDFSADMKELYGQSQFAVDVARGKAKVSGKIQGAGLFARAINTLFFGQTMTAGTMSDVDGDQSAFTISGTTASVTPPNSGTFVEDLGIVDINGVPWVRVASAPTAGQYAVSAGTYTFAAADSGKQILRSYRYTYTLAGAQAIDLTNLAMGASPTIGLRMRTAYQGKRALVVLNRVVFPKLGLLGTKTDDYSMPELEFSAFADGTNSVGKIYVSE